MIANRKFGVEIECGGVLQGEIIAALQNAGIQVDGGNNWVVKSDGSIKHLGPGAEIVSPILEGEAGLAQVQKVCDVLAAFPAIRVNETCGLHVHVDARDLKPQEIANVAVQYGTHEQSINCMMPSRRRDNHFSRNLSGTVLRVCQSWASANDLNNDSFPIALHRIDFSRYHTVNLNAFLEHGTIEFRQHEGTVLASKILPWIEFCVSFVEACRLHEVTETQTVMQPAPPPVPAPASAPGTLPAHVLAAYASPRTNSHSLTLQRILRVIVDAGLNGATASQIAARVCEMGGRLSASSVPVYVGELRCILGVEIRRSRLLKVYVALPSAIEQLRRALAGESVATPVPTPEPAPVMVPTTVSVQVQRLRTIPSLGRFLAALSPTTRAHFLDRLAAYV